MPAKGKKTGQQISWLVFGVDKRLDEVRGQPLLSLVLQSCKAIDCYKNFVQRKATVNSILAMFVKKTKDKLSTLPMFGLTSRAKSTKSTTDNKVPLPRKINIPNSVFEELAEGEEPILKGGEGTDINFGTFKDSIINSIAWDNEIPPEILKLSFSKNYSASQAAINEFKMYLDKVRLQWEKRFAPHL